MADEEAAAAAAAAAGTADGGGGGTAGGSSAGHPGGTAGGSHSTAPPSKNTRKQTKGKAAAAPHKGKQKAALHPMSDFEEQVMGLLQQGTGMTDVVTDKMTTATTADLASLEADLKAVETLAGDLHSLDLTEVTHTYAHLHADTVAVRAGLQTIGRALATKIATLKLPPAGTSTRGGAGNRRNSTSSTGGRRSRTSSTSSRRTQPSPVQNRLLAMAAGGSGPSGSGGAGAASKTVAPTPLGGWGVAGSGGSSSSAFPSWIRGGKHPFNANACTQADTWYMSLPFPWNALPQRSATSAAEVYKLAANTMPKFDGIQVHYEPWRSSFIPCVHLTNIDVSFKCLLLRSSLEGKTARMKEFMQSIVGTEGGYEYAIRTLEDRYGGQDSLLLARQEALLAVPELREGEYRVVELLHSRLGTFLLQWAGVTGTEIDETESLAFYTQVMSKVESSYALRYHDWLRVQKEKKGLQSLHAWLGEQLYDHRQVEIYHRRRLAAIRAAKGLETGNRPPRRASVPPPAHLDRNYAGKGFLTLEEEWEEAAESEEEGGESAFFARGERDRPRPRPLCPLCQAPHPLGKCDKFKALQPKQRKELLVKENRCFLCFQRSHPVTKCRFPYNCASCGGRHHTMIHGADEYQGGQALLANEEELDEEGAGDLLQFGLLADPHKAPVAERCAVSLRTIPLWVRNPKNGRQKRINALLDDGCTGAGLLAADLAEQLNLTGPSITATTEGVGGKTTTYRTILSQVEIKGPSGAPFAPLKVQVMKAPAGSYRPIDWTAIQGRFPHLRVLPLPAPILGEGVQLLIGSRAPLLSAALEERRDGEAGPIARRTPLGWTVTGPTAAAVSPDRAAALEALLATSTRAAPVETDCWPPGDGLVLFQNALPVKVEDVSDRQLQRLVEKMLKDEEACEVEVLSPREEFIVQQAKTSICRREGRYQVGCTWAPATGRPRLNLPQAERRLRSLEESKHFRDERIRAAYKEVVESWKHGQEVKKVPLTSPEVQYLMPHFPVVNLAKESTPVRVVMDCKVELNRHLLAGPNLLNEVPAVLLRFRSGLFTFSGDVKKMFLRIFLPPEDRPFHCFLWRDSLGQLEALQFQVHVFGNAGSPFLAVYVVKEHAKTYVDRFPVAVDTILRSTLIDDVLDSADSIQEARELLQQVRTILSEAGMAMAKFHANHPDILASIPGDQRAGSPKLLQDPNQRDMMPELKTLGVSYDPTADVFSFPALQVESTLWTKRKVLKLFPRLYEPLGLLLPFVIRARIFFSSIAHKEQGWDKRLPPSKEWERWVAELEELDQVRFPRCLKAASPREVQLHLFADASQRAYAAAAYVVCLYEEGRQPTAVLVAARAHVAPSRGASIPRLELMAAELTLQLRQFVLLHLKLVVSSVFHWTDSTTVLYWLKDDAKRFQAFVHNRLQKIRRSTDLNEWHWTPTDANPADLATRGMTPAALQSSSLWKEGPSFLLAQHWPPPPTLIPDSAVLQELRKAERVLVALESSPSPFRMERHSHLRSLYRLATSLFRWRDKARATLGLPPLADYWRRSERLFVRQAQEQIRDALSSSDRKTQIKKMGLFPLPPMIDEEGLVRGKGRLHYAKSLPRDLREPLLLPRGHHLTLLHLRAAHEDGRKHAGGTNAALNNFLTRFWTPKARAQMYKIVSQCVACRRRLARPQRPPEAPLPALRLPGPEGPVAFAVLAVDCAGPYRVKRGRSYESYYMLLLTCCQVRAVRLEVLSDLSTDAFLMALTRASARGVNPHTILSDNGTNFEGANRLLQQLWAKLQQRELEERKPLVKWKFNPPYASHYGGVFERLVGAAKAALYHALPSHLALTLEQLQTAFAEVEALLNSRPLAYVSTEGKDPTPLTPNHFLAGSASIPVLSAPWPAVAGNLARRWELVEKTLRLFHRRFEREVLPHYQAATRRRGCGRELKVGDVVTFLLPTAHHKWPLALVTAVFPGKDGHVRTIEIWRPSPSWPRQPIRDSSVAPPRARQPIRSRSVSEGEERGAGGAAGERKGEYYRRDVGAVALLLPVEDTNAAHI